MQEGQTVTFQPMYVGYRHPWFTNLFVLYLLVVFVVMMARVVRVAWNLRKLRRLEGLASVTSGTFEELWTVSRMWADSLKKIGVVTVLLAAADLSLELIDVLDGVSTEKVFNSSWLAGNVSAVLVPFAMAMLLCAILFMSGWLLEGGLMRRKLYFDKRVQVADGNQARELR